VNKNTPKIPLYNTREKQLEFLQTEGNVITFKDTVKQERRRAQVIVSEFTEAESGEVVIEGMGSGCARFKNIEELLNAVDWQYMEESHRNDPGRNRVF
jgi:hypothetical protein